MKTKNQKKLCRLSAILLSLCMMLVALSVAVYAQAETGSAITDERFPDPVFRQYLAEKGIDQDGDGLLSQDELDAVSEISFNHHKGGSFLEEYKGISDLTGISNFRNLKELKCAGHAWAEGDAKPSLNKALDVSNLYNLQVLDICGNKIPLVLGDIENLVTLECNSALISSIDLSHMKKLECLDCANTEITKLDLSHAPKLDYLNIYNTKLIALNVGEKDSWNFGYDDEINDLSSYSTSVTVTAPVNFYDLRSYDPLLDPSKISNLKGATLKGSVLSGYHAGSVITYDYNCGNYNEYDVETQKTTRLPILLHVTLTIEKTEGVAPAPSGTVELTDAKTGVSLSAAEDVLPADTVLVVVPSDYNPENIAGKFVAFDISLEKDGVKIQPNGKVKVTLPIPAGYDKAKLTVYRVEADGSKTELPCTVNGDAVTFETDHFSVYLLAEKAATPATEATESTEDAATPPMGENGALPLFLTLAGIATLILFGLCARRKKIVK